MDLKQLDLNLLLVFNQLLAERSVSGAARALGLSQPAVSNALARLRKAMGDELFLRTSRGMEPTPRATQLAEPVAAALQLLQGALRQDQGFDPATSSRAFTIGMTDIGEIYFLPGLMEALAEVAPGVTVSTVRNTAVQLKDEMESGHVDLALGLLPQLRTGFFQRRLFTQHYVCLMRQGHPLDKRRIGLREFSAAEHLAVVSAGTGHGVVEDELARQGIERRVRLTVPHFVALGHILAGTDMIATVPERLAQRMAGPFGLRWLAHPAPLPEIGIHLLWHARLHREPANQWLRQLIATRFGDG
ncbi:LysR family transcriptional regulator [Pseudacidovorax intermedius]|uniref:LysR family transcriptional regulator n=1 Tax=Pseudacidovorax intermedius TaxID=433924 RepID=A0A370FE67_9BURK|nr:LysR family transcriptional regulator [Pseudacidovorax intermedius]RDI23563.1 LysR family transcriptional regulator [Pseudacidovorax intermedius]